MADAPHRYICENTGNPSGTDTWPLGRPGCKCDACVLWRNEKIEILEDQANCPYLHQRGILCNKCCWFREDDESLMSASLSDISAALDQEDVK